MRIDLHLHTNWSDGALAPEEVIDEAARQQVSVIAITDHDTTEAYSDALFAYAEEKGITLVCGIEISTKFKGRGVHILGYHLDVNDPVLKERLDEARNARHIYLYDVSVRLRELGYTVHTESLDTIDAVTKAHIALDILNNPENEARLLEVFGHIPDKGEFIETIMNKGCPGYVMKKSMTPVEAAELIRQAGGRVVLAHPVAYRYQSHFTEEDIDQLVQEIHADGIEANYIYVDRYNQRINETAIWNAFAREYHLKVTIGSDFHKKDGIHPVIGLADSGLVLDENEITDILDFIMS